MLLAGVLAGLLGLLALGGLQVIAGGGLLEDVDGGGVLLVGQGLRTLGEGLLAGVAAGDGVIDVALEAAEAQPIQEREFLALDLGQDRLGGLIVAGLVEFPGLGVALAGGGTGGLSRFLDGLFGRLFGGLHHRLFGGLHHRLFGGLFGRLFGRLLDRLLGRGLGDRQALLDAGEGGLVLGRQTDVHAFDLLDLLGGLIGLAGLDVGGGLVHEVPGLVAGLGMAFAGQAQEPLGRAGLVGLEEGAVGGLGEFLDGDAVLFVGEGLLALGEGLFVGSLSGDGLLGVVEEFVVGVLVEEGQLGAFDGLEALERPVVVVGVVEFLGLGQDVGRRLLRRQDGPWRPHQPPQHTQQHHDQQNPRELHRTPPSVGVGRALPAPSRAGRQGIQENGYWRVGPSRPSTAPSFGLQRMSSMSIMNSVALQSPVQVARHCNQTSRFRKRNSGAF